MIKRDEAVVMLLAASVLPVFEDPFHQKPTKVIFWEWIAKELWELGTGIELALRKLRGG